MTAQVPPPARAIAISAIDVAARIRVATRTLPSPPHQCRDRCRRRCPLAIRATPTRADSPDATLPTSLAAVVDHIRASSEERTSLLRSYLAAFEPGALLAFLRDE